jgi:transcriptional regulator with XRE-family HTH domain
MVIGNNIRHARSIRNMKQSELAALSGISTRWLSNIENEYVAITSNHLSKIAAALNISQEELIHFHHKVINPSLNNQPIESANNHTTEASAIVDVYKRLIDKKNKVIGLLEEKLKRREKN